MKMITQQDYEALPIVGGRRKCPGDTDYAQVKAFGDFAQFGNDTRFGNFAQFGNAAQFGNDTRFGNAALFGHDARFGHYARFGNDALFGHSALFGHDAQIEGQALLGNTLYIAGGFGSENRTTLGIPTKDGVYVCCGCWAGWLNKFRKRVLDVYADSDILFEYQLLADLFEKRWERDKAEGEG